MALALAGAAVFIYLLTFIWPHTPIYQGDNAPLFLLDAVRMSEGQVIYRDFFELTFPGTQLVYLALFETLGIRAWIPGALLLLFGVGLTWLSIVISKQVMTGASVFLPGALYLSLCFGNALDATHHWFSILAVMAGLAVMIQHRSVARVAETGALCGLATCFTQSRGALAVLAMALFLVWEWRATKRHARWLARRGVCLFAAFLAVSAPFIAYFIWRAGVKSFVDCTFGFPLRYYAAFNRNNLGVYMVDAPDLPWPLEAPALGIWLLVHALLPLLYLLFFARQAREAKQHPEEPWDRLTLLNLVGLSLFLAVASAPNWFKVSSAALPALILLVWFVRSSSRFARAARLLLWLAALAVAVVKPVTAQTGWRGTLETPVGRATLLESDRFLKARWLLSRTRPRDFFLEAGDTDLYFLLDLRNPATVSFLTPTDYTRPEQVQSVLDALERRQVRFVLWPVWLDLPEDNRRAGDHLRPLRANLRNAYHVVKTFPDGDQVWERK